MAYGSGHLNSALDAPFQSKPIPPRLLLELEPGYRVFFRNLGDALRFHRGPELEATSSPGAFWPDVFVTSRMPWWQFAESIAVHVIILASVWGVSRALALRPQIITQAAFHKEDVIYYSPSEYLQPIDTGNSPAAQNQKGQPEYAKQPIISVPPEADNHSQTIITPPNIKLDHDVPLPNMVAWNGPAPAAPLPNGGGQRIPDFSAPVVAPAPEITQAIERRIDPTQAAVVAPAPSVTGTASRSVGVSEADVVAPPPNMPRDVRLGDMNVGHAEIVSPAPQLPVSAQRTLGGFTNMASQQTKIVEPPPSVNGVSGLGTRRGGGNYATAAGIVPPSPSVQGVRSGTRSAGGLDKGAAGVVAPPPTVTGSGGSSSSGRQLVALSLHPAVGAPPAEVAGNRRGSFSATPEGKAGSAGTPDVNSHSVGSHGTGGGAGANRDSGLPAGIHVGPGPNKAGAQIAGEHGNGDGASESAGAGTQRADDKTLVADNRAMRVTVSPSRSTTSPNAPSALERQVFGDRKSYGMVLNMPNLNSGGGSWVIRFAELKESVAATQGNLIAPEATHKVDPGYPLELMRQNVRGTVTLYAVIHSDGSVSDVKVLDSPDERLDQFARTALTHWQFKPAMKNGVAVALEAVVRIPFTPAHGW